jgi:crossover junction endodeoxyribonuclease RusA
MRIEFTAFGIAKPAGSKTAFAFKRKNGSLGASVVDACKTTKPWQAVVSSTAMEANCGKALDAWERPLFDGALLATFRFYVPRPKSHYNSKGELKANAPAFVTKKPDVLKLARAVEDALTGIVYRDDSQIVIENISKHYGEPARCEVKIETLA